MSTDHDLISVSSAQPLTLADVIQRGESQTASVSLQRTWNFCRLDGLTVELAATDAGKWRESDRSVDGRRPIKGFATAYASSFLALQKVLMDSSVAPEGYFFRPVKVGIDALSRYPHDRKWHASINSTVQESEVQVSLGIIVDLDIKDKLKGVNATPAQRQKSMELGWTIREYLLHKGVDETSLAIGCSGNGCHILVALDIPWANEVHDLRERFLKVLAAMFDTSAIEVDTACCDGARLIPLYGTHKRKGPNVGERLQHRSWLVTPDTVHPLSFDDLESLTNAISDDLTDDQREKLTAAPQATVKTQGATKTGKKPLDDESDITKANALDVQDVYGRLGSDPKKPTCPSCQDRPGKSISWDRDHNMLHCFKAGCIETNWSPFDLVAYRLHGQAKLGGDTKLIGETINWFVSQGLIETKKRRRKAKVVEGITALESAAVGIEIIEDGVDFEQAITASRPVVKVSDNSEADNDAAIQVLRDRNQHMTQDQALYERGGRIVRILDRKLQELPLPTLREKLASSILWVANGAPTKPPKTSVEEIAARGTWGFPRIRAVQNHPAIRPDGQLLMGWGYHADSETFVESDFRVGVPERPSLVERKKAAARLLGVFSDFPFVSDVAKSVFLAALLTPGIRAHLRAPAPFFLFRANTPGTGKELLIQSIAALWSGEDCQSQFLPNRIDEQEKTLVAIAKEAPSMVVWSDLSTFGNKLWSNYLTAQTFAGRELGSNKTNKQESVTTHFGSGNNTVVSSDCTRRVLVIDLSTDLERPELRTDFKIVNLRRYILAHREELLLCALTILRGHIADGASELMSMGSFEAWAKYVGSAVMALGLPNPCESYMSSGEEEGTDHQVIGALYTAWASHLGVGREASYSSREVSNRAKALRADGTPLDEEMGGVPGYALADSLFALAKLGGKRLEFADSEDSTAVVSYSLRAIKGRVVRGAKLVNRTVRGTTVWCLERVDIPPQGGHGVDMGLEHVHPGKAKQKQLVTSEFSSRVDMGGHAVLTQPLAEKIDQGSVVEIQSETPLPIPPPCPPMSTLTTEVLESTVDSQGGHGTPSMSTLELPTILTTPSDVSQLTHSYIHGTRTPAVVQIARRGGDEIRVRIGYTDYRGDGLQTRSLSPVITATDPELVMALLESLTPESARAHLPALTQGGEWEHRVTVPTQHIVDQRLDACI